MPIRFIISDQTLFFNKVTRHTQKIWSWDEFTRKTWGQSIIAIITLSVTSSTSFGALKFASWRTVMTHVIYFPEKSYWCNNMPMYFIDLLSPVKVSRPYFSLRPKGTYEIWSEDMAILYLVTRVRKMLGHHSSSPNEQHSIEAQDHAHSCCTRFCHYFWWGLLAECGR